MGATATTRGNTSSVTKDEMTVSRQKRKKEGQCHVTVRAVLTERNEGKLGKELKLHGEDLLQGLCVLPCAVVSADKPLTGAPRIRQ